MQYCYFNNRYKTTSVDFTYFWQKCVWVDMGIVFLRFCGIMLFGVLALIFIL